MTYHEPLSQMSIGISISESDDLAVLGLAEEHLRDAMTEISRHMLAMGARLVYGGDLRDNGYTKLLFELVTRHRRDADIADVRPAIANYLPWPVHSLKSKEYLTKLREDLEGMGELYCLDREGNSIAEDADIGPNPTAFSDEDWSSSLTAMRHVQTQATSARVVLGGRVTRFKGRMPGIAEETEIALKAKQPLYLLGGFGGCARDIASEMGLIPDVDKPTNWPGRMGFSSWGSSDLANGLNIEEIRTLARTVHIDQAVALILRGMLRLSQ
ncbi:MAG: hypothetical protein ACU0B9_20250 [Limimaricola soesokkakensis]|uniref:hypothetical protein n=1 Tax=Limimaricola soesokkakensis TaxID=1343159 RepID=UPI0040596F51